MPKPSGRWTVLMEHANGKLERKKITARTAARAKAIALAEENTSPLTGKRVTSGQPGYSRVLGVKAYEKKPGGLFRAISRGGGGGGALRFMPKDLASRASDPTGLRDILE